MKIYTRTTSSSLRDGASIYAVPADQPVNRGGETLRRGRAEREDFCASAMIKVQPDTRCHTPMPRLAVHQGEDAVIVRR